MKNYIISVNGKQYNVTVEEADEEFSAAENEGADTASMAAALARQEELAKSKAQAKPQGGASKSLKSPMPGQVVKINFKAGDEIKKGQVFAVIEAMKMETEISAAEDGKIAAVNVQVKDQVETGTVMYTFN